MHDAGGVSEAACDLQSFDCSIYSLQSVCVVRKVDVNEHRQHTILFTLNLINVYMHRQDCSLASRDHLAERFQMQSFEPEGLQLT